MTGAVRPAALCVLLLTGAAKAEFNKQKHVRGSVAMARLVGPDTAGSQFYIMLGSAPELDGQYTVFGKVTSGMDVVDKIVLGDKMKTVKIVEATP